MNTNNNGKLRILVVESEPIAREILADLLKMAGYDVVSAASAEQALLTLVRERGRIDCLYTCLELPGLVDGWMLADEFRQSGDAKPIVFASTERHARARGGDATTFVASPALPPKVVEAVNELTGRSEAARRERQVLHTLPDPQPSPQAGLNEPLRVAAAG